MNNFICKYSTQNKMKFISFEQFLCFCGMHFITLHSNTRHREQCTCIILEIFEGGCHDINQQTRAHLEVSVCSQWSINTLHWDIHASVKACCHCIFCLGKNCHQQFYPRQKMPMATFSQPYMCMNKTN